jgi:hypothetical protein
MRHRSYGVLISPGVVAPTTAGAPIMREIYQATKSNQLCVS